MKILYPLPAFKLQSAIAAFLLLVQPWCIAALDTNSNGLSDAWEKQYNQNALFASSTTGPLSHGADPDGDGWTNAQEAAAGTNPFSSVAPLGNVQLQIQQNPTTDTFLLQWQAHIGKSYQLQWSVDLALWENQGNSIVALQALHEIETALPNGTGKGFWRLEISDVDTDGDQLSDYEEHLYGTNPTIQDSDANGTNDLLQIQASLEQANPLLKDADYDGKPDLDDADTSDNKIFWDSSPEHTYAIIDLNMGQMEDDAPLLAVFNDQNEICRINSQENNLSFWDGQTYPLVWQNMINFDSYGNQATDETYLPSIDNSTHIYLHKWNDGFQSPLGYFQSASPTYFWSTPDSVPIAQGITGNLQSYLKAARFGNTASEYRTTSSVTLTSKAETITKQGLAAENTLYEGIRIGFGFKSISPGITRSGRVLAKIEGQHKISDTNVSFTQFLGITDDPHGNVMLCVGDSGTAITHRLRNGVWEEMPLPGIVDMNPDGIGLTFPDYGLWRNGETVDLEELMPDSEWAQFECYQINKGGNILGSAIKKTNSARKPVLMLPAEIVSRDKYLAGSFEIPQGWDNMEMEFLGPSGSLGRYGSLLTGSGTKVYDHETDVLNQADYDAGGLPNGQKVIFVRDQDNPRKIRFYSLFPNTGLVKIKLYLSGGSISCGEFTHQLEAEAEFATLIDYIDSIVTGEALQTIGLFPEPDPNTEQFSPLTAAALMPFFNVINNVESISTVVVGLYDGILAGLKDDYQLILLIKNGTVLAGDWAYSQAEAEINLWLTDPLKRAAELKQAADTLCKEWIFDGLRQVSEEFGTWEGFRNRCWRDYYKMKRAGARTWLINQEFWGKIRDALAEWGEDFGDRIIAGAEKNQWSDSVMVMDKVMGDTNQDTREASYFFGYTYGYLVEQIIVGKGVASLIKGGTIMVKGGVRVAGLLAARRVLPILGRLHLLKRWLASVAVSVELKVSVERGLVAASKTPISTAIKDSAAEVIERTMARLQYERGFYTLKHAIDNMLDLQWLKLLVRTPGREGQLWQKMAEWMHLMGDSITGQTTKGWTQVYNRSLKFTNLEFSEDRIDDLYALMKTSTPEGKAALKKSLDEFAQTDGTGKFWLRDLDTVYDDMYHYLSAASFNRLRIRNSNTYLSEFTGDRGWYVTPAKFLNADDAKSFLQLNSLSDARYRCKFKTAQAKDNLKAARGDFSRAEFYEFTCRDFPPNAAGGGGVGGASQLLLDHKEVLLDEVFDTVLQRNLTIQEIQNLGGL